VLVDEHDIPAMHLYSNSSLDNPEGNAEIITSIHHYAKTIADLLENSCKSNVFRHKFLMCGVSNSVIDAPYSAFNNLVVHDVLDSRYANFFSLSKQEVEETVNFLFGEIRPELRNKIISNVDEWYNGYYGNDTSPMYSLFSTGQYLNDCFYECITRKIHPQETSEAWIPEPQRYWTKSAITSIFNNYLSIGFQGTFTHFLFSLMRNNKAEFEEQEKNFPPLLEDPARSDHLEKIIFHLLLHAGYFGADKNKDRCFKIPNKELEGIFIEQLEGFLKNIPTSENTIDTLSEALISKNYTALGDEIMKSLNDTYGINIPEGIKKHREGKYMENIKDEEKSRYPSEAHINYLLGKAFYRVNKGEYYSFKKESGQKGAYNELDKKEDGHFPDFRISPKCVKDGIITIFELKTETPNRKHMQKNALFGLQQIFEKKYHKPDLNLESTKAIVSIGIAANSTDLGLAILELKILGRTYSQASKLMYMEFKYTTMNDTVEIVHLPMLEANIIINQTIPRDETKGSKTDASKKPKEKKADSSTETKKSKPGPPTETNKDEKDPSKNSGANVTDDDPYHNEAIMKNIANRIIHLKEHPSEFNETVVELNSTVVP
jgi:hypothetical protein